MGCAQSKDLEGPVDRSEEAWDAVLSDGFAVQMTESFKSTDADYIEAILSANYSSVQNNAGSVKAMETDDLFLIRRSSGNRHQHNVAKRAGGDPFDDSLSSNGNTRLQGLGSFRKSWPDLKAGLSKLTSESEAAGFCGSMEDTHTLGEPEVINTWQLMQGLDDDDELSSLKEANSAASRAFQSAACEVTSASLFSGAEGRFTSVLAKPIEVPAKSIEVPGPASVLPRRSSFDKRAGRRARSKSFTSILSVEDVDAAIFASCRNSKALPCTWEKTSSKTQEIGQDNLRQVDEVSVSRSCLDQTIFDSSALDSQRESEAMVLCREWLKLSPDNRQRVLSMKYMSKNSSGQCDGSWFAPQSSDSTMNSSSDAVTLASRWTEGDGPSSPSSPEFSAAASLKDWLTDSGPLKQPVDDLQQTGFRRCNVGGVQDSEASSVLELHRLQSEPAATHQLSDHSKGVRSTAFNDIGGGDDQFLAKGLKNTLRCHEAHKSVGTADKCTTPVFDPELLESLEMAMHQLSEDEWNAGRKMQEESVNSADSLHLMNSLTRNASNSVKSLRTTGKGNANSAAGAVTGNQTVEERHPEAPVLPSRSLDGNRNKQVTKEEKAAMRHHSSEEFQKGIGEDEERAVFYTTSFQGNAKIYEECNSVRTILSSLETSFDERNIYLHPEYEQELRNVLEMPAIVPSLLVKGRAIIGIDNILQLYKGVGLGSLSGEDAHSRCKAACLCRGGKFLICSLCNGRGKLVRLGQRVSSCRHCSGTGLIKCPNCSLP